MNVSINSPSVSTWPPLSSNYTPYVPMNATGLTQKNRGLQREFVNQTAQVKQTGVQILTNTVKDFFAGVQKGVSNYVFSWFSNDETTAPPLDANASAQQKHQYRQEKRRLEASHKRKNEGPTPSFITSPTAASSRTPSFDPSLPMVSESEKKNNFQFSTTQKSKSQRQTKASLNAKTEGSLNRKMPVTQKEKKQINPVTQINKNTAKIEPKKSMTPQKMDFKIMKASHLRLITKHRVWLTYMEEKMRLENARIPLEIQRCLRDENTHTQQKIDALTAQLLSLETKYEKENKALDQTFELTKKKIENLFLIEKLTSHSSLSENNESIDCKERREMFKTVNTFSVINNEAINAIFQKSRDKLLQEIQRGQNTSFELSLDQEKHIEVIKISSGRLEQLEQLERKFNDDLKAQRVLIRTMKETVEQACHLTKNKHFKFSKITDICDVAANRFDVDCSKKHMCKNKIESLTYQMRIKRLIEIAKENQEEILEAVHY